MEKPDTRKMREEQRKLAGKVIISSELGKIDTIGGVDQAYAGEKIISAVVVMERKSLKIIEKRHAVMDAPIPYIPGFLSYRESPVIMEAYSKLENKPDILMLDCHGILHPLRFGMASHVGVMLDIPTIGVAKNLMCGELKGDSIEMEKEVRGRVLETKEHAKPVYVSPGHRISLEKATEITKALLQGHKLPEPLHEAHKYANKIKRRMKAEKETSPR